MNTHEYLVAWAARQPSHRFDQRDASSISWDFIRDPKFLQVRSDICRLVRPEKERLVTEVLLDVGIAALPNPIGLLADALEVTCQRQAALSGVLVLIVTLVLATIASNAS
jgi:hypothetical protein